MKRRLTDQQRAFQEHVLRGGAAFLAHVADSESLDARARLSIYAEAYRLRLREALESDFVALRAHLGAERFERLCRAYVDAHPSGHWSLRRFGAHVSEFLAAAPPWDAEPFLSELARFEWALVEAFDAADRPVARLEDMAALPAARWPEAVLCLHASVQRFDLVWNAPAVWRAVKDGQPPPAPVREPRPLGWIVWRKDLQNYFRPLPVEEAYALDAIQRGASFGAICEGLLEWMGPEDAATRAAGLLKLWLTDGLVGEVRLP